MRKPYKAVRTEKQIEFNKLFGKWLQRNMRKKFWTYDDVAANVGVSKQTVNNWIHGGTGISLYHYLILKNIFGKHDDVFDAENFGELLKVNVRK